MLGDGALYVAPGDAAGLADALLAVAGDPALRARLLEAGRRADRAAELGRDRAAHARGAGGGGRREPSRSSSSCTTRRGRSPRCCARSSLLPSAPQLIVVDTDSSDDGPALARAAGAEVVELGGNPGFGAANNAGVARARHPVTVLLNPDCELLDGSLARLVARADDGRLWVPRLLNPDGSVQRSAHPLPGTAGALLPALVHPPLLPEPLRERVEPYRAERPRSVGWAIAACLAARTDVLRRLGPFDARQFLFFEDMDLCLRARAAGIPTVLDPTRARPPPRRPRHAAPPTRASRTSCSRGGGARSWPRTAAGPPPRSTTSPRR